MRVRDGMATHGRLVAPAMAIVLSWALAQAWAAVASAPVTRVPPPLPPAIQRADSLFGAGARESSGHALDSLVAAARARGDRELELKARVVRANHLQRSGEVTGSLPDLRWCVRESEALRDSFAWSRALQMYAFAIGLSVSPREAFAPLRRARDISRALGDLRSEGMAWAAEADGLIATGEYSGAVRELNGALATLERWRRTLTVADSVTRRRNEGNIASFYVSLGDAYVNLGRLDSAAAPYDRAARLARPLNRPEITSLVLNAQAALDDANGDPERASLKFLEAYRLGLDAGLPGVAGTAGINFAGKLIEMRRFDEAVSLLDSLGHRLHEVGNLNLEVFCCTFSGDARMAQERPGGAVPWYRRALTMGSGLSVDGLSLARLGLSEALFALDSLDAARAALEEPAALAVRAGCIADRAIRWDIQLARIRATDGDLSGALAMARHADALAATMAQPPLRSRTLTRLALAQLAAGDSAGARASIAQATQQWEETRAMPGQADWRERWGGASDLAVATAEIALGDTAMRVAHAAAAFEGVQRFKSRTLHERIHGVEGSEMSAPVSLTAVQSALRPGELLLDAHVGSDVSWLFAVTRSSCEATRLPGARALDSRARSWRELVVASGRKDSRLTTAVVQGAAEGVTRWLLGPLLPRVSASSAVIVSPDGPLALLPFAALRVRGAGANGGAQEWLGLSRDLVMTPSVSLWLAGRAIPVPKAIGKPTLFAFAASGDTGGHALPGAVSEVKALKRAYAGVTMQIDSGNAGDGVWREADALHFASHSNVDDQHPWRSALLLSPGRSGAVLRASEIAAHRLRARLVVLSACGTAGGQVISGEGVLGLGSAFLVAGAPVVIATQWPVDDEVSRRWSRDFYAQLARGCTVREALRNSQRTLAGRLQTSSPAYWAPYTLIGDGEVTLPLKRRFSTAVVLAILAAIISALAAGAALSRRKQPNA